MSAPDRVPLPPLSEAGVCPKTHHLGPFVNGELYDDFGGMWVGFADCLTCGSTIQVRTPNEMKEAA